METNNNRTYIGITIGPISRIMSYTRSLKSLWAASYLLSYIGKTLVTDFYKEGRTFLKPHLDQLMWDTKDGVGRFPDQYIFESQEGDWEEMWGKREQLFKSLGEQISQVIGHPENKEEIISYLRTTVKVYILEMSCPSNKAVEQIQQTFSLMECQDCYPDKEGKNYLADYFEMVDKDAGMLRDAYGNDSPNDGNRLFPTIIERAGAIRDHLIDKRDLNKDGSIAYLPTCYKYIAFVSADGDHIGKAIGELENEVSKKLLSYNQKIAKVVANYHGQVIYAGGDDLLFYAPIHLLFSLIEQIDKTFNSEVADALQPQLVAKGLSTPSLSFGVSISYYKHPMTEAINLSEELLRKAKSEGRDRICWNSRKHSGQSAGATLMKEQLPSATALINTCCLCDEFFLHSMGHYLQEHREILAYLLKLDENRVKNYINSTFNDESHENNADVIENIQKYLLDESRLVKDKAEAINRTTAILRFIELNIRKGAEKGGEL